MARLFFALWPAPEAARELEAISKTLAEASGGKPVPAEKIHLTLAFLGEVAPERARSATEAATAVRGKVFEMKLDGVGSFRGARVAWAGTERTPPALESLQEQLAVELGARMFVLEERPFVPHVTLVRKIARNVPRAAIPAIAWRAEAFTLVRSETGAGRYLVVESWRLRRD